jgi:hypothetical protein
MKYLNPQQYKMVTIAVAPLSAGVIKLKIDL